MQNEECRMKFENTHGFFGHFSAVDEYCNLCPVIKDFQFFQYSVAFTYFLWLDFYPLRRNCLLNLTKANQTLLWKWASLPTLLCLFPNLIFSKVDTATFGNRLPSAGLYSPLEKLLLKSFPVRWLVIENFPFRGSPINNLPVFLAMM